MWQATRGVKGQLNSDLCGLDQQTVADWIVVLQAMQEWLGMVDNEPADITNKTHSACHHENEVTDQSLVITNVQTFIL